MPSVGSDYPIAHDLTAAFDPFADIEPGLMLSQERTYCVTTDCAALGGVLKAFATLNQSHKNPFIGWGKFECE